MAEIMRERDGFSEVFVEPESAGDVTRGGRDFNGVSQPGAQVVASTVREHLRFIFEPAERAGMNDAVAVALVFRAPIGRRLLIFASASICAELRVRGKGLPLEAFKFKASARHAEAKAKG